VFVGHLAVALAAKKVVPAVPLAATVAAAFALDLVWPILLLTGVEVVQVRPGDTAFTNLAFASYPWTHSLGMVLIWSAIGFVVARSVWGTQRAGMVLGALVLSHWVLDWITHRPDLPLWPGGPVTGLGLWNSIPGTIGVEAGLLLAGLWIYRSVSTAIDRPGAVSLTALLVVTGLLWIAQPWAPLPASPTAVAWGAMVLWLLPPSAAWIERHRRRAS
jgi:hypothetical protein